MNIPQEIAAAYDESTQSLVTTNVGTASGGSRSYTDPERIWRQVVDEDAGRLRVVVVG